MAVEQVKAEGAPETPSLGDSNDWCKAESRASSVGGGPVSRRSSFGRLFRIEGRLSHIEEVGRQNVIPYQAWMIEVPCVDHVSRHYISVKLSHLPKNESLVICSMKKDRGLLV